MINVDPPENPAPPIATGTAEIIQKVFAHNQELMQLLSTKYGKSVRKNTNSPPTPSIRPRQGQPHHPMLEYFDKYCCTHGRGSHKGVNFNSKAPGHKYKAAMERSIGRRNYGFTE